ncbi:MAG TPA: TonB-dependent receptor [Bryobacteraceae bacterium]|nr:TonB-dependent receptor [Bryobacteraceae bacterium]
MKSALLLLALAQIALGQISAGSISGQIADESGGVMSGVTITARQESTGFVRSTVTDRYGEYRIEELSPGVYSIRAERPGFRTAIASHIIVEINQRARLSLRLKLGEAHESVVTTERVSPVQTEDSAISYRLDWATFSELPLDERRVASLVTLGPGAIPRHLSGFVHDSYNDIQQGSRGSVALNPPINGARSTMNSSVLDGAGNTDRNTFATVIAPPMEAVQEFRIQSSLAPVAFAQSGGGVVDVVTKSGGRNVHGSAFEYLRNEATDARNYFEDPELPRSDFRRNQFGASLGGPLPLRSTFFFGTYEGLRGKSASPLVQLVPDATLRGGDFRGRNVIYDPLNLSSSGAPVPFSGNIIPANRIDPIASRYLSSYEPLPNRDDPSRNYVDATPSTSDHDLASGRIDHQLPDSGLLFVRYILNDERGGIGGNFPLRPTSEKLRAQQVVVGHTRGGASWSNELRASFTRLRLFSIPVSAFQQDVGRELGILNPSTDPFTFGLPFFFLANFSTVTDDPTLPQVQRDNTWGLSESFSKVRGRRTYRAGFHWTNFQLNYRQSSNVRGRYVYSGAFTGGGAGTGAGDALADFLLGFPQTTQRTVGNSQGYLRQQSYGFFVQQDWRATSNLSVSAGLRYEYYSPYTETRSALLNLDYSALPLAPRLVNVAEAHNPNRLDFSPRVGLAWRLPGLLSSRGSTVFRAGYGIYYNPEIALESYSLVLNGIRNEVNSTSGFAQPVLTTRDGFPSTPSTGFPSYFGLDRILPTPYVQQWNAGFQRELPGSILLEAAYVGSKGVHLGRSRRFNTPLHTETGENLDPRPGNLQSLRTFPSLGSITQFQHSANSSYHSLQLKTEKRFQKSLTFLASFVWSKSIDDASSVVPSLFDSGGAQDERNLRRERALSAFHVGRRLSAGFVYGLPAPNRLRFLLRGWELSGVVTLQDGTPFDPLFVATDTANAGTFTRPDIVPGQELRLSPSQRTPERWFNTAAFTAPPPFQFGNAGRNIILGPGNQLIDLALHKRFRLTERANLEFRAESFNTFNKPNFGFPDPYPDHGPFFGRILLSGEPRRVQFASRIEF